MEIQAVYKVAERKYKNPPLRITVVRRQHASKLHAAAVTQEINLKWREIYADRFSSEFNITEREKSDSKTVQEVFSLNSIYGDFYGSSGNFFSNSGFEETTSMITGNRRDVVQGRKCLELYLRKLDGQLVNLCDNF